MDIFREGETFQFHTQFETIVGDEEIDLKISRYCQSDLIDNIKKLVPMYVYDIVLHNNFFFSLVFCFFVFLFFVLTEWK
jgi:hypothetical protein